MGDCLRNVVVGPETLDFANVPQVGALLLFLLSVLVRQIRLRIRYILTLKLKGVIFHTGV